MLYTANMPTYQELARDSGLDRPDIYALFHHLGGYNRAFLITHGDDAADPAFVERFSMLAARRRAGEPVAYLLGEKEFYSLTFNVGPGVLIPRPDTELLVDLALERLPQGGAVVDLGTGSGIIAITLAHERPDAHVTALDVSEAALHIARGNAARLAPQVSVLQSDWYNALADEKFALIVSNPPYIEQDDPHLQQGDLRFEPRSALTDEADGLVHIRQIINGAVSRLLPGGWLLFEHGFDQGLAARDLLEAAGFTAVQTWQDIAGMDRVSGGLAPA
ncbi:release factor glutamine methyltransferase [Silvimonas terrae]|uniref:Release factor glutamine methyltransferase n=1 Tax=Silvimonas terrae TaxID=300266 RepID=A0A840RJK7_9NEIS|nr:peptide chain release factor N(5)-glutamine methyltransferase [Silvimonas terrae]MBB5192432.1 release factor glutamine methyltransferase [Silvimonas terrae]